jgi:glycosyltransferase involved in cell wall biosynthesis
MQKHIVIDARIRRASTGRYIDRLIEHLQKLDSPYRYTVLLQPDDPWQPTNQNFAIEYCRYPQFSLNPLDQFGFPRQLKRLKPDLVHFGMNAQPLLYNGKVVTTTMDLTMLRFTRAGKTPLPIFKVKMLAYCFLFWYSNYKSKKVITISNFVKKDLAQHYPFTANKTVVTYCASEPPLTVPAVAPIAAIREPFVFYVGMAFPHKNLERLISAFELLAGSQPDLQLVLVGKREQYYEKIEQLADQSSARSRIVFTGFVPDEELKWLYQHASAYVFPSLSEGFGLPGLEAMAHDCPVLSSNATCLPEVYQDGALYFDPNNPKDIADKIELLITHPALANELRVKGRDILKKYSWRRMAEQTLSVYDDVLQ